MKLKSMAVAMTLLGISASASADTVLGVYVGAEGWMADYDGGYGANSNVQPYSVDDDDVSANIYVALEHPLPFVPNVKIKRTALEAVNSFGEQDADFDNTDYTLYYEVFDNDIVSIDLGINGKAFDGNARVIDGDIVQNREFSGLVPTAYGAARVGLPFTNWTITGEAKALSFDDSDVRDIQAAIEYRIVDNMAADIAISAGYRSMKVELDDMDGVYSDLDFKGPYLAVDVHF